MKYIYLLLFLLLFSCESQIQNETCDKDEVFNHSINLCVVDLCVHEKDTHICKEGCHVFDNSKYRACTFKL